MRSVLRIGLFVAASIGCFAERLPAAHVTACRSKDPDAKACLCTYLGYPPEDKRVKTDQRAEILADWRAQDGAGVEAVRRVVNRLGPDAGRLRDECDALVRAKVPADDRRWETLYRAACQRRREIRLEPHRDILRRIVFTKHFDFGGSHYAYTEGMSDAQHEHHFQPGSSLCLLEMENGIYPKFRTLIDDPGGVLRDPDVSHDGRRVVFAWKKSYHKDDYHLYEIDLKTEKVRQLTSGLGFADYEPIYTPGGNIVFSSTRCIQTVDCWFVEVSNLYTCDGDGRYMRRLGFDQVHTTLPTATEDGRVIYTRWDYNDRGQMAIQSLFQMNPDGTAQRELYGNNSHFPTTILHARSIPGTGKYVAVFAGHHARQRGWLGILDPRKGRQENQGAQLIAPLRETPAVVVDQYGRTGDLFQYPYPLSETAFLVAAKPAGGGNRFALFLVNIKGERELLYRDRNISCNQPIPVRPRSIPKRADMTDYRQKTGTVYLHDVYIGPGLSGVKRGTIKGLRVVALGFRPTGKEPDRSLLPEGLKLGGANKGPISGARVSCPLSVSGGTWDIKKVLGTATVHDDGSACFKVPAREPIFFQALDAEGQMVQSMRSWMTLQPGETASCIGCHERKSLAPPVPYSSQALAAGAETLNREPFGGRPEGFSFPREIQPILNRHCIRCHHLDKDTAPDVKKKTAFSLKWPASYNALADRKVCNWINAQSKPPMLPPYYTGAAQSRLIKMFREGRHTYFSPPKFGEVGSVSTTIVGGKHYGARLSDRELAKLIAWIDIGVPCFGDYVVADDNYFRQKRRHCEAEEADNIRRYLARPR